MAKISKQLLEARIKREMERCTGSDNDTLSLERTALKKAYYGDPYAADAKREEDGLSTIVDRSVMETVEWAKAPLLKVFAGTDDLVRFEPTSPEDEQYAQDATDYVNRVVFGRCGFDLVYGPLTDGLYQRVGWAKVYFDESAENVVAQEFEGLGKEEAELLVSEAEAAGIDAEVENNEADGYAVRVREERRREEIKVMPLPSERVVYSSDALSLTDARFVAHWEDKMAGDLISEGYSKEFVETLPGDQEDYPETQIQRERNSDGTESDADEKGIMRVIRVYEAYMTAPDEKGKLQRLKVQFAGSGGKYVVMDSEEWTMPRPPIFAFCSLPLPYSPVGLCVADLVVGVQKERTEYKRVLIDNMRLSNMGEFIINRESVNDTVDSDQFLSRAPGRVYETTGRITITPFPIGNISPAALSGLELSDKAKEQLTGIGMTTQGLSADVLQNTATGAAIQEDAQNQRLEAIVRIYAETYKDMARYVLLLAHKYMREPVMVQRKGRFAQLTPQDWNPNMHVTVAVGLGTGSRQKKAEAAQAVIALQATIVETFGKENTPVRSRQLHNAASKYVTSLGFDSPEQFLGTVEDWEQAEAQLMQQGPEGNPEEDGKLAIEREKLKIEQEKAQAQLQLEQQKAEAQQANEVAKIQAGMAIKSAELEQSAILARQEAQDEAQLAVAKMELEAELDAIKLTSGLPKAGATIVKGQDAV